MNDMQAALKDLQSFKQLLQQMAKALWHAQLQNNLPGSKRASQGQLFSIVIRKRISSLNVGKEIIEVAGTK